jgi:hypothetical protein
MKAVVEGKIVTPEPGDFAMCPCTAMLVVTEDLGLKEMTKEELIQAEKDNAALFAMARKAIAKLEFELAGKEFEESIEDLGKK